MLSVLLLGGLCGQLSFPDDTVWLGSVREASIVAESEVAEAEEQISSENFGEISAESFAELSRSLASQAAGRYFYVARVGVYGAYEDQDQMALGARFLFDFDTRGNAYFTSVVMGGSTYVRQAIVAFESEIPIISVQSSCTGIL